MNRRRLVLEEMGIAPIWRLRSPQIGVPLEPTGHQREAEASAAPAEPDKQAALGSVTSPAPILAQEQDAANSESEQRKALPPITLRAGRIVQAKAPVVAPESGEESERRAQILHMDWDALKASVSQCVACPLHEKRTNTVFGVGDEQADWLFVGEGPGAEEDTKGEPFVGQAGRLLDNMLAAIDMKRGENVYIANVVKCRPPGNRNPESGEMRCCEPYLTRQIALLQPNLIVAMGKIAASHLLQTNASIASLRGRVHDYRGTPLIVTYHPAYLLRTLPDKEKSWADLCFARETMKT